MKLRPINFKAHEVRAIREGRKTQTRRIVKWPVMSTSDGSKRRLFLQSHITQINELLKTRQTHPLSQCCPYGQPGDRLWVRETWGLMCYHDPTDWMRESIVGIPESELRERYLVEHAANWNLPSESAYWRPSIQMPRWASRITLEILSVRVERLQDIAADDLKSEGVDTIRHEWSAACADFDETLTDLQLYKILWESINGPGSWDLNPWVWVVEFKDAQ